MKTQISEIIKGSSQNVGTNYNVRQEIIKKVYEENGDLLNISIKGKSFTLKANKSLSGRLISWTTEIDEETFRSLCGNHFGVVKHLNMFVFGICAETGLTFTTVLHLRNESCKWKHGCTHYIPNENVTII